LKCRLPISNGQPGSGGFVVFPGGKFVADPASNVVITGIPTPSPGQYNPGNFFGLTYDRRYSKWLPVLRNMVTRDETRYVYALPDGVYVRNVGDGTTVELGGAGRAWTLYDVESEGVYANPVSTSQLAVAGMWLIPFTGDPRQVATKGYWQLVGGGVAYGFLAPSVPAGATQALMRLDLKTGAITQWYADLPQYPNLLGLDAQGRLIVLVPQSVGQQVLILTGSNQAITIFDGSTTNSNIYVQWAVADSNGLWLATGDGLYLSRANGTPEKVSDVAGPIGGPCV
jgi:hypothetical protein